MARQGNLNMMGSVRVVQTDVLSGFIVTLIDGHPFITNNGAFGSIVHNAPGDASIFMDDDYRLAEEDIVEGQLEGNLPGLVNIDRISQSEIRITVTDAAGELIDEPYSYGLNVIRRYLV
jgi:hypothetical protein